MASGFTRTYHIHRLVYYATTADVASAISRENQLKAWKRDWKVALIEKDNPEWEDLYSSLLQTQESTAPTRMSFRT